METRRPSWEEFHREKGQTDHALEWPDEYVVRFAKSWAKSAEVRRVLDMNCGAGRHTALLSELGFRPTALDLSRQALQQVLRLLQKRHLGADLVNGSSLALTFRDGAFDAVIAWRSLHVFTLEEIPVALAEMSRVVRPGGHILFSTRSDRNIYREEVGSVLPHPTDLTLEQIEQLCRPLQSLQIELSEATSQNRRLRDSYWVVAGRKP